MLDVTLEERKEPTPEVKEEKKGYDWKFENNISNGRSKIELDKDYSQWRINNVLVKHHDPVPFVNEVNIHPVEDQMHYDYLFAVIRKQKRWSKAETKEEKKAREREQALHDLISDYYKYNAQRTKEALRILTPEQIEFIKERTYKGGVK